MNPADPLAWSNTVTAQVETVRGLADVGAGAGQMLVSLLCVLAVIGLLAWVWRRMQPPAAVAAEDRLDLLYYNQFNAHQVFVLWEQAGRRYAAVFRGRRMELLVPWPADAGRGDRPAANNRPPRPATFQDVWGRLLASGRRKPQ